MYLTLSDNAVLPAEPAYVQPLTENNKRNSHAMTGNSVTITVETVIDLVTGVETPMSFFIISARFA